MSVQGLPAPRVPRFGRPANSDRGLSCDNARPRIALGQSEDARRRTRPVGAIR
ncbi:hypothetical protein [Primorskyibacter sp. S187A]|uniref:hypothetical protein n=1 Tax=Primorskyibacter sp. S187A TaxID=3415130 RepID=UPI003C7B5A9D